MEKIRINHKLYGKGILLDDKFIVNTGKSLSYEDVCTIKKEMEEEKKRNNDIIIRQKTTKRRII